MLSISLIIVCSLVLFVYWFRYSCLLILQARSPERIARGTFPGNLKFHGVQQVLRSEGVGTEQLDRLSLDLWSDYGALRGSIGRADVDPIERRMLLLDYRLMHVWFVLTRRTAPPQARQALQEMAGIVGYFADFARSELAQSATA